MQEIKDSDPADNAIRRVYADWLLDQGREEQADFIRYQKDHDDPFNAYCDPGRCTPEGRAAAEYAERTLRDWVGAGPSSVNVQFRRGLLHAIIPMPMFLSGRYGAGLEACRRAGWVETIELIDVQDVHLRRLPYAMARPSERLALRSWEITLAGLALLEDIRRLESVELAGQFADAGEPAKAFAQLSRISSLRRLVWTGRLGSEAVLQPLADADNLRSLSLENVGLVRDEWFAPIFALSGLRHLSITGARSLTDAFLEGLEALVNLRSLCLYDTGTFVAGIDRLRRMLPGCNIDRGFPTFGIQQGFPVFDEDIPF